MADQSDMESAPTGNEATTNATPAISPDRKVFAGGLPQEAKKEAIREYFSQFREIEAINLKTDSTTGQYRRLRLHYFEN